MDNKRLVVIMILLAANIFQAFNFSNTYFLFLLPMMLLFLLVSWFLAKEIQKENEESLKLGIKYMKQEAEAQRWLHKSFVPKARKLAQKELGSIIIASGVVLESFIFLWSFFVSGLVPALLNTFLGLLFFVCFIVYTLYAPKEFTRIYKYIPNRYRHHGKNDWIHAYLLLFPFAVIGFFLYSLTTTGEGLMQSLGATIILLFSYTLLFICLYCIWFLYREYQEEVEEKLKQATKKIIDEK